MQWLEKHINGFFNLNAALIIAGLIFGIWGIVLMIAMLAGFPHTILPSSWEPVQRHVVGFFLPGVIKSLLISTFFVVLFLKKKNIAFPLLILVTIIVFGIDGQTNYIAYIDQFIFFNPSLSVSTISCFIDVFQFVLCLIGTMLWIRKLTRS
ncbi:MAG: hypothetical protein KAT71_03260 [Gammaproteobacteria bacterium]|nr:hypothetical protein [Gammaproteobacteria bacterium]